METTEKTPIRATLKDLNVGGVARFHPSRLSAVRTTACNLGIELDRKYKTKYERDYRRITVTRIA